MSAVTNQPCLPQAFRRRLPLRTLTDIFTPASAPLGEGLRTLTVSPERFVEPGVTVRAIFAFTNVGGGAAKGVRVRFALPEGLTYLVDSGHAGEVALDSLAGVGAAVKSGGADIGEVQAGEQRSISVSYVVAPTIENGTVIELQAAISSPEVSAVGSNIVRLIVRSKPDLRNEHTCVTLTPLREPAPGAEVVVAADIRNVGESSASGVVLVMPAPVGTAYIPGSAQIDGADFDDQKRRDPFGYGSPLTVARKLGPGASMRVHYRARIDETLPDGAEVIARATVSSAESSEFEPTPASLRVSSSASFDGDQTEWELQTLDANGYLALITDEVRAGQRVAVRLTARNVGMSTAHGVTAKLELPDGLTYAPGSLRVDGQPFPEPKEGIFVLLGDIAARGARELTVSAGVISPAPNGRALPITATLRWPNGSRVFSRLLSVVSEPHFSRTRTCLRRLSPAVLEPGDAIGYEATIVNDGTTVAEDVVLALHADERIEGLEICEEAGKREVRERRISLGSLEPQMPLTLSIFGRVRYPVPDGEELLFGASVSAAECAPFELEKSATLIRARPRFMSTSSSLRLISQDRLRPDRVCTIAVCVRNEGNDRAQDVRVALRPAPELRLETVEGAVRDGLQIVFGDVEAGESREAEAHLRLVHLIPRGYAVEVQGVVVGRCLAPVMLDAVSIQTYTEASFTEGGSLVSVPRDVADAGAELRYDLVLRNTGDGTAKELVVKALQPDMITYVPSSTSINGRALLDHNGTSLLWSEQGLVLNEIAPGTEVRVGWLSAVNTPLPPGTVVQAKALVAYDQTPPYEIESAPVVVRSAPVFSIIASELPFVIAALPGAAPVQTESAPFIEISKDRSLPPIALPEIDELKARLQNASGSLLRLTTEFSQERLDRTLRFLNDTDFSSLLTHFFVLRAFFPGVADGSPHLDRLLEETRGALRSTLDRLFVGTRGSAIGIDQLEDSSSREAVTRLFSGLGEEMPTGVAPQRGGIIRIVSLFDPRQAQALAAVLEEEPLTSVAPWYVLAHLLGETLEYDGFHAGHIGAYRDALIETLSTFIPAPIGRFHHALTSERFPLLEEALRNVLSSFQEHAGVAAG